VSSPISKKVLERSLQGKGINERKRGVASSARWRATCQKPIFHEGPGQKCPDYCKDMTLREPEDAAEESGEQGTK